MIGKPLASHPVTDGFAGLLKNNTFPFYRCTPRDQIYSWFLRVIVNRNENLEGIDTGEILAPQYI